MANPRCWGLRVPGQTLGARIGLIIADSSGAAVHGPPARLVGAGGGGFLLFYAADKAGLRAAMKERDLDEVRFDIDYDGSTTALASR